MQTQAGGGECGEGRGGATLTTTVPPPAPGSTTTCSCGSPRTCFPPPPLPLTPLASRAPRASGMTTSRYASQPSSWVGGTPQLGSRAPHHPELGRARAALPGLLPTWLLDLTPDSDSDEEDAHFFSVGASGAPQPPAPESPSPRSQSTFSTLVTVLQGRVTALCETKVRAAPGRRAPWTPVPPPTVGRRGGPV